MVKAFPFLWCESSLITISFTPRSAVAAELFTAFLEKLQLSLLTRAAFFTTACYDAWGKQLHHEQMMKVIWHKAASPPSVCGHLANTTESSVCGQSYSPGGANVHSHLLHPNCHPHCTGAGPCWVTSHILTVGYVWICPGLASWRPFMCGYLHPYLIHGSLGPPESISRTTQHSFQPLLQGSRLWQTDRQTTLLHL